MTQGAETVDFAALAVEAAAKMKELDVGSLPVCNGNQLEDLVTDRDITRLASGTTRSADHKDRQH